MCVTCYKYSYNALTFLPWILAQTLLDSYSRVLNLDQDRFRVHYRDPFYESAGNDIVILRGPHFLLFQPLVPLSLSGYPENLLFFILLMCRYLVQDILLFLRFFC